MLLPRALKGADLVLYSVFKSLGIQIHVVPVIMEDDYKGDEDEGDDSEQSEKEQVASEKEQGASEKDQGASEKEQGASEKEQSASEKGEQRHLEWNISLLTNSSARRRQATCICCHWHDD